MRRWLWVLVLGVWGGAWGQEVAPTEGGLMTLRVYQDLVQIPVLVLRSDLRTMAPVTAGEFALSIDSGPLFRPTHVRREGDDAISLAVMIDLNGVDRELLKGAEDAVAAMVPAGLNARDHLSVYTLDCALTRSSDDQPADAAELRLAVERGLKPWRERGRTKLPCAKPLGLFDALGYVSGKLAEVPGRRVIVLLSKGADHGSAATWREVVVKAHTGSVAVVGLRLNDDIDMAADAVRPVRGFGMGPDTRGPVAEDPLNMLCQLSGGVLTSQATAKRVATRLREIPAMLRERYIVEFPRPHNGTAGTHGLEVTIAKQPLAYIRSAGITFPIADAALANDPTVMKNDPTKTPEEGKRRILKPK